jgi:hypothetical protein
MFHTLFGLSIRVLPSWYPGLSAYLVSWNQAFETIMYETPIYQPVRVVWIFTEWFPT